MTSTLGPDLLRGWSDQELAALLRSRPDLVVPVPADLTALAARIQSRSSVGRVLDRLTRFQLEVLDALRLTRDPDGATSLGAVLGVTAAAGGVDAGAVREAVQRLRAYLLIHGEGTLRVVPTVDELLGPYPAGLGRPAVDLDPAVAALVAEPAQLRRTLLAAPQSARAVLDRLAAGPPVGTTDAGNGAIAWLVEHRLLAATSPNTVELPREVGVLLRRGVLGALHPEPPVPAATVKPADADAAGAGQAMEAVRRAEAVLEALADEPAPLRRSGEFGVRELRRVARAAGVEEPEAGLLIDVGYAAGLLGEVDAGSQLMPTVGYDGWRGLPLAARWYALVGGWLAAPQTPMGTPTGGRRAVLRLLAGLPAGTAPSPAEVRELIEWYAPRQAGPLREAPEALTEAAALGVTGRGALTSYGAALLGEREPVDEPDDDPLGIRAGDRPAGLPPAAAKLDGLLPVPVDEVLVQADLTVVVPGPPEHTLATELALVADPESTGVYRVSGESLRRALDAGYTAEDLHAWFDRRSRTPVPQGLRYLIDDVARRHGGLRVGSTRAYLRSDDEALVAQVLADRRLADLGLRRLAPTVLASAVASGRLLAGLREAGYAPVAEDATGAAMLVRPERRRAPARSAVSLPAEPRVSTPRLLGIIEDLRRAEAVARAARRAPATVRANGAPVAGAAAAQAHADAMAVLQQAVREKALVWVGYVDSHGERTSRLLRPVSIGAGYLRAEDERTDTLHTLALHRITAAALDHE